MRFVLLITAVVVTVAGCNRPVPTQGAGPVVGYEFEVRSPAGGYTKGQGATFAVQDGPNAAELKDGRLTVNGKGYGSIADGAKIVVDADGKVTVNGQARSPK